jgi:hypothetical protein
MSDHPKMYASVKRSTPLAAILVAAVGGVV